MVVALIAIVSFLHSVNLMRIIHDAGVKQSRFSPAVAAAVKHANGKPIYLRVENEKDRWIYNRMTHDIHGYDGVKMNGLTHLTKDDEAANYKIQKDGTLKAL